MTTETTAQPPTFAPGRRDSDRIDADGFIVVPRKLHARSIDDLPDDCIDTPLQILSQIGQGPRDGLILANPDPERLAAVMRLVALKLCRLTALKDGRLFLTRRRRGGRVGR